MNPGVIFLIVFVVIIIGVVFFVLKTMKKMNGDAQGVAVKSSTMKSSQDFIPFADIENDIIDLGGFQYRMIIEVSSVNYILKNEQEQFLKSKMVVTVSVHTVLFRKPEAESVGSQSRI